MRVLNRVTGPCSKLAFSDWWGTTAGDRWLRLSPGALDHRRFREAMDATGQDEIKGIERRIAAAMVETFAVDLSGLVLDMTNFATWIDPADPRAPIAQRGHSKQKRNDLRICGLGLVVSTDGGIPLVSHAYPGSKPDVTQFGAMATELVTRFAGLLPADRDAAGAGRLALVYDAGQNSDDNYELPDATSLSFVGSLPPSDHPDLLAVPRHRYRVVDQDRLPGLVAFETSKTVLGRERRFAACHSDGLHDKQSRGFTQTLAKAHRQLADIAARLARGKTRKPREKVEAEIATILAPRWVSRVMTTSLAGKDPAELRLSFGIDEDARAGLETELFGKRVLFSDKTADDTSTAQIIAGYRSQEAQSRATSAR